MRIALAHDYLTQRGGAERVTASLTRLFPNAPLYTSVYEPSQTFPDFKDIDIRTSPLQRFSAVRQDPRLAFPLLAAAWSATNIPDAEAVVASSSGWSHAVRVPRSTLKVIYCHNPARWLYQTDDYMKSRRLRYPYHPARWALTRWDKAAARSADAYLANSWAVAERIERHYGIRAEVLHPPISINVYGDQEPVTGLTPGFWLTVARGRGYKNVAAVLDGVKRLDDGQLAIVGSPPDGQTSNSRTRWLGIVSDQQLRWLYANARGLVSVSLEDFGLTPLEANAFGTPVAVLRGGGFLDSLAEGTSGVFIEQGTADSVHEALRAFPEFPREAVALHARTFDEKSFGARLRQIIDELSMQRRHPRAELTNEQLSPGIVS